VGSPLTNLLAAIANGVFHAKQNPVKGCKVRPKVFPILSIADPKIVLVKKAYQTRGHRLRVSLGTDSAFTGTGTLSAAPGNQLRVFDESGVQKTFPMQISGAKLSKGVMVYVEGAAPSAGIDTITLSLALAGGGDKDIVNSPATDKLTSVEVFLELGQYKSDPAGGDPAAVGDKIGVGRNLHVQTADNWAGRALLTVLQARPAAYAGKVVLTAQNARVRAFAYGEEKPLGQVAQADPLETPNGNLGARLKLWVEGAAESAKVRDTGFTLGIEDLPGVEGDRANITVVKAELEVYDLPAKPGDEPLPLGNLAKMDPGRRLHLQDADKRHGRARVVVKRVTPSAWTGSLELQVWDATADNQATKRVKLLTGAKKASPELSGPIAHPGAVPKSGKKLWAEGALTSDHLRDTELRLRVADAEGGADRARFTVHEFFVNEVRFSGVADIYYARIPDHGSYILTPAADPPARHLASELRPALNTPHWKRKPLKDPAAEFSWPAVYAQRDAVGVAAPVLTATLELFPKVPGTVTAKIKAVGGKSGIELEEQDVTFTDGDAANIAFNIQKLPKTVDRLDGLELEWYFDGPARKTKHTLFITDQQPLAANNDGVDEYLWEVFEWSCVWAKGKTGEQNVFNAIWKKFHPVAAHHATGLVYWKNHEDPLSNTSQTLADAIQSQDGNTLKDENAASCVVFDSVLLNCIGAQGIASAEVKLTITPDNFTPFARGGHNYTCSTWNDTTTKGQGNPHAPPHWRNHWIAAVHLGGKWLFYDPSYGDGPVDAPTPAGVNATIDVASFEPHTVASFNCMTDLLMPIILLRSNDPAIPPHLEGTILWDN